MTGETLRFLTDEELGAIKHTAKLSNGTPLMHFERPNAPVCVRAVVLGGSRTSPDGKDGIPHFVEHTMMRGTRKFSSKEQLVSQIEGEGGNVRASTGIEMIDAEIEVSEVGDLESGFEVLQEMVVYATFDPDNVEIERSLIGEELLSATLDQRDTLDLYQRLFFQETDIEKLILGTPDSLARVTTEDLIRFRDEMFVSGRMAVVSAGGVSFDEVRGLAEEYLTVPQKEVPTPSSELPIVRAQPVAVELYPSSTQVNVIFGCRTVPIFHPDNAALGIISESLCGGRGGALVKKLQENEGLVYDIDSRLKLYSDSGAWVIKTATAKNKLQKVIDGIIDEVKRIQEKGLKEEEIYTVKKRMIKKVRRNRETSYQWVEGNAMAALTLRDGDTPSQLEEQFLEVTTETIRDVMQRYFTAENWYLGLAGDVSTKDVLVNL